VTPDLGGEKRTMEVGDWLAKTGQKSMGTQS
jgi:hypothetical protein